MNGGEGGGPGRIEHYKRTAMMMMGAGGLLTTSFETKTQVCDTE